MDFCFESDSGELGELAGRHTLACMLARVAGRSPLEYLDDAERALQRQIVLEVISSRPRDVMDVIDRIARKLDAY
jgi:hypothetical protein